MHMANCYLDLKSAEDDVQRQCEIRRMRENPSLSDWAYPVQPYAPNLIPLFTDDDRYLVMCPGFVSRIADYHTGRTLQHLLYRGNC